MQYDTDDDRALKHVCLVPLYDVSKIDFLFVLIHFL